MSFGALLLLSIGLAMDAAAVAAARGVIARRVQLQDVVLIAACFGGFQALMPLLGWLIGARIGPSLEAWDHWIAFALLGTLGAKMIWDARNQVRKDAAEVPDALVLAAADPFGATVLLGLGVATSIDAFAVGVTLPMLDVSLLRAIATIGVTTAILSALGVIAGRHLGAKLGPRLDVFGGLVLIALGTKILFEHLTGP